MTAHLYTIGYEGQTLEAFLRRLAELHVRLLVDVRELPLSRKRGFSKRALAAALTERGIAYTHMPSLGCPRPIRDKLKADRDWPRYALEFGGYLRRQRDSVSELAKLSHATTACLLCFEADFAHCHRSIVARAAAKIGAPSVVHITAETAIPDLVHRAAA
ncbi:MAG: DUF488 family protein [Candidatus Binatia bacterium]